jgi:hypothetical protein
MRRGVRYSSAAQTPQAISIEADYLVEQECMSFELDLEFAGASIVRLLVADCIASLVFDAENGKRRAHKYYNLQYERRVVIFKQRVVRCCCP